MKDWALKDKNLKPAYIWVRRVLLLCTVLAMAGVSCWYAYVQYHERTTWEAPLTFSPYEIRSGTWSQYKRYAIEAGSGRTLDASRGSITTSEGQSYTMLRAVWMDDRATFDAAWDFTRYNMQRPEDHLISWLFGKRADGTYGVVVEAGGNNTASDADSDIALALLMAYSRWNQPAYLYQARQIIVSIWDKEVVEVSGKPIIVANNLEREDKSSVLINSSYFSPAAYRLFARVDAAHDWLSLVDNSYTVLHTLGKESLSVSSSVGLPPDWALLNRQSGAYSIATTRGLSTDYGYDALRIPWRVALDYAWNRDGRSLELLKRFASLSDMYKRTGIIPSVIRRDGVAASSQESIAMYGAALGYFVYVEPSIAKQIYERKLLTHYDPDRRKWRKELGYYDDNWAWFGVALYQNALPNLAIINN